LFTIGADTEVYPDSLNQLVLTVSNNGWIIGICGETKLSNEKVLWWTMIQVYEFSFFYSVYACDKNSSMTLCVEFKYYTSHHLSKVFESFLGSVTCLPDCFTLYGILLADKGRLLVVSNLIIDEYAEINVDVSHFLASNTLLEEAP
jgi:chitin synthase